MGFGLEEQFDDDCDGIPNACDNCINHYKPNQIDLDFNGQGDACEQGQAMNIRCFINNDSKVEGCGDGYFSADKSRNPFTYWWLLLLILIQVRRRMNIENQISSS